MEKRTLSVSGYGIYVVSIAALKRFLTTKQIKRKKLLSVFRSNHDLYIESLKEAVWFPILPIASIDYDIMIGCDEVMNDSWTEVFTYDGFNLAVEDGSVWIGCLTGLAYFKISQFNPELDCLSYQTLDGETLNKGFRIKLEKGKYRVAISGYKKSVMSNGAIYGYRFNFEPVDEFTSYNDPRDDEQYTFNMVP